MSRLKPNAILGKFLFRTLCLGWKAESGKASLKESCKRVSERRKGNRVRGIHPGKLYWSARIQTDSQCFSSPKKNPFVLIFLCNEQTNEQTASIWWNFSSSQSIKEITVARRAANSVKSLHFFLSKQEIKDWFLSLIEKSVCVAFA